MAPQGVALPAVALQEGVVVAVRLYMDSVVVVVGLAPRLAALGPARRAMITTVSP